MHDMVSPPSPQEEVTQTAVESVHNVQPSVSLRLWPTAPLMIFKGFNFLAPSEIEHGIPHDDSHKVSDAVSPEPETANEEGSLQTISETAAVSVQFSLSRDTQTPHRRPNGQTTPS